MHIFSRLHDFVIEVADMSTVIYCYNRRSPHLITYSLLFEWAHTSRSTVIAQSPCRVKATRQNGQSITLPDSDYDQSLHVCKPHRVSFHCNHCSQALDCSILYFSAHITTHHSLQRPRNLTSTHLHSTMATLPLGKGDPIPSHMWACCDYYHINNINFDVACSRCFHPRCKDCLKSDETYPGERTH